jgi:hypothetical protein
MPTKIVLKIGLVLARNVFHLVDNVESMQIVGLFVTMPNAFATQDLLVRLKVIAIRLKDLHLDQL